MSCSSSAPRNRRATSVVVLVQCMVLNAALAACSLSILRSTPIGASSVGPRETNWTCGPTRTGSAFMRRRSTCAIVSGSKSPGFSARGRLEPPNKARTEKRNPYLNRCHHFPSRADQLAHGTPSNPIGQSPMQFWLRPEAALWQFGLCKVDRSGRPATTSGRPPFGNWKRIPVDCGRPCVFQARAWVCREIGQNAE